MTENPGNYKVHPIQSQRVIAVDPGIKGAIAFWSDDPQLIGSLNKGCSYYLYPPNPNVNLQD